MIPYLTFNMYYMVFVLFLTENSNRDCWIIMCFIYTSQCENSPYSWHRGELVESWCRWRSCSLQLVPSSYRYHQRGAARSQLQNVFFNLLFTLFVIHCMLYEHNQSQITDTSGGFLNDLLTPAERFSPWVTPLLGPMAPMVSSDCRGFTGIPVTPTTLISALWPLCDSLPSTWHSHWVSLIFLVSHPHTDQGHIQSETTFNSSVDEITELFYTTFRH